jgi:threonine dehydratase
MTNWKKFVKNRVSEDMPISLNDALDAVENISQAPYARPVTLFASNELSQEFDVDIYFAVSTPDQAGKNFKFRGALNKLIKESEKPGTNLIPVAASAGNHAQGVALAMSFLGERGLVGEGKKFLKAKIFMPLETPRVKIDAVKKFGGEYAEVVLVGKNFSEAKEVSEEFIDKNSNALLVHPFDDFEIIAGQGALMLEILMQLNFTEENSGDIESLNSYSAFKNINIKSLNVKPDVVYVPCGGGGLAAGTAVVLNELCPNAKVVAVEPTYAPSATIALYANCPIYYPKSPTPIKESPILIATGIAVQKIGEKTLYLMNKLGVSTRTVTHDQLNWLTAKLHEEGMPVETAGSAGVAGFLNITAKEIQSLKDAKIARGENGRPVIVCFLTGANIDPDQLELMKTFKKSCPDYPKSSNTIKYDSSRSWARE